MNKALYFNVVPPSAWLKTALLLYHQIAIIKSGNTYKNAIDLADMFENEVVLQDAKFIESLSEDDRYKNIIVPVEFNRSILADIVEKKGIVPNKNDKDIDLNVRVIESEIEMYATDHYFGPTIEESIKYATDWIKPALISTDLFLPTTNNINNNSHQTIFHALELLLPTNTEEIELNQIIDFREENKQARIRFIKASGDVIDGILGASSELESNTIAKDLCDQMAVELRRLKKSYKSCNIDVAVKLVKFGLGSPLAALGILKSFPNLPIDPNIVFLASLLWSSVDYARFAEDKLEPLKTDQWAYLWNLSKLNVD